MKAQIITLESHDDLISVRDRMSWAKSPRILLVWPKFERITLRPVDLRILQQHAAYLGADLGLVTRRGDVRRDAVDFGIPIFRSTAAAQRESWPAHKPPRTKGISTAQMRAPGLRAVGQASRIKEAAWRSSPVARIGFFGLGVLAVLAVAALFVPRTVITIVPASTQQETSVPVTAGTAIASVQMNGSIPAHTVSVTIGGTQAAQITSRLSIPQDKARGIARFKNLTQSDLAIPAETVVYGIGPNAMRFVTMNDTHLTGGVNAIVEVPIQAEAAGAAGNVPANSIQAIDGSVGLSASVTNASPTSGGSDRLATAPSADDRKRVRDVLIGLLAAQAQKSIAGSIGPQDLLFPSTLKMGQVAEEAYDPPAGQAGTLLNLRMRADFGGQYVKAEDLNQVVARSMEASTPDGYVSDPSSYNFHLVGNPVPDESGALHFVVQVDRTLHQQVDLQAANSAVRGVLPKVAVRVLGSRFALAKSPVIETTPPWWPWLPLIPFRIAFNLE